MRLNDHPTNIKWASVPQDGDFAFPPYAIDSSDNQTPSESMSQPSGNRPAIQDRSTGGDLPGMLGEEATSGPLGANKAGQGEGTAETLVQSLFPNYDADSTILDLWPWALLGLALLLGLIMFIRSLSIRERLRDARVTYEPLPESDGDFRGQFKKSERFRKSEAETVTHASTPPLEHDGVDGSGEPVDQSVAANDVSSFEDVDPVDAGQAPPMSSTTDMVAGDALKSSNSQPLAANMPQNNVNSTDDSAEFDFADGDSSSDLDAAFDATTDTDRTASKIASADVAPSTEENFDTLAVDDSNEFDFGFDDSDANLQLDDLDTDSENVSPQIDLSTGVRENSKRPSPDLDLDFDIQERKNDHTPNLALDDNGLAKRTDSEVSSNERKGQSPKMAANLGEMAAGVADATGGSLSDHATTEQGKSFFGRMMGFFGVKTKHAKVGADASMAFDDVDLAAPEQGSSVEEAARAGEAMGVADHLPNDGTELFDAFANDADNVFESITNPAKTPPATAQPVNSSFKDGAATIAVGGETLNADTDDSGEFDLDFSSEEGEVEAAGQVVTNSGGDKFASAEVDNAGGSGESKLGIEDDLDFDSEDIAVGFDLGDPIGEVADATDAARFAGGLEMSMPAELEAPAAVSAEGSMPPESLGISNTEPEPIANAVSAIATDELLLKPEHPSIDPEQFASLKELTNQLQSDNERLDEELTLANAALVKQESDLEAAMQKDEELELVKAELSQLQSEIAAEKETFDKEKQATASEKGTIEAEKQSLESEKQALETKLAALQSELETATQKSDELERVKAEFSQLQSEIAVGKETSDKEKQAIASEKGTIEAEKQSLESENQALETKLAALQSELEAATQKSDELERVKAEFSQLQSEIAVGKETSDKEKQAIASEKGTIEAEKQSLESENQALEAKLAALQPELEMATQKSDELEQVKAEFSQLQSEIAAEKEAFENEKETIEAEMKTIDAERQSLESENQAFEAKLASLQSELEETKQQLAEAMTAVESANNSIDLTSNSAAVAGESMGRVNGSSDSIDTADLQDLKKRFEKKLRSERKKRKAAALFLEEAEQQRNQVAAALRESQQQLVELKKQIDANQ